MDANLALTNADYACSGCNEDQASHLKDWLPSGYDYHFCTYRSYTTQGTSNLDHKSFEVSLRIALKEICEVKEWVKKLSESSGVSWRVAVTKPSKGQRVLYKAHYRCQHNVCVRSGMANQRRLSKNTQCGAKMVCTLVNTVDARGASSRSKDPHITTYPTSVRLYNVHNHNIFVAEALRHRDVGAKAIETLTQLFEIGHNPTSALAVLKSDLLAEHGNKYVYASANRTLCPDLQFCYRNKKFLTYLQSLYSRRESWALSYRRDLPTRGNQTNNYVEAAMRVLKDKILQRTKAFNLPQLFNLFTTRLEMYYEARVTDIALGHWEAFHRSRFLATESNIKPSDISQILTLCSAPVWRGCFVSVGLRVSVGLCIVVDVFVWMFPCSAWIAPLLTTPPTPHSIPSSPTSTVVYATIAINPGPCYFRIDFAFSLFVYIFNKHCHISPAFASTHFVSLQKNLANMEAAGDQPTATLEEFLQRSLARMDHQDKVIEDMQKAVHAMVAKVSELSQRSPHTTLPTAPPTPPAPSSPPGGSFCPEPRLPIPEKYSGEPNYCRTFLSHCSLHFAQQPRSFFLEETKVAFTLSLLTGKAAVWGTAVWENKDICCSSFSLLSEEMKRVFDRSVVGKEAARLLTELRQGERSVSDYAIEFRTLAAECRWNEEAQWDHFLHGLADRIQREIITAELPTSLNGLVDLVIRVDARLSMAARRKSSTTSQQRTELFNLPSEVSTGVLSDLEPMQVGRARLSREERNWRRSQGLCMYCGEPGHQCQRCPVKDQAR
nr:uncharacterized protein LOC129435395 isoform X2 [Misgurnus anguillicaudatus]